MLSKVAVLRANGETQAQPALVTHNYQHQIIIQSAFLIKKIEMCQFASKNIYILNAQSTCF